MCVSWKLGGEVLASEQARVLTFVQVNRAEGCSRKLPSFLALLASVKHSPVLASAVPSPPLADLNTLCCKPGCP